MIKPSSPDNLQLSVNGSVVFRKDGSPLITNVKIDVSLGKISLKIDDAGFIGTISHNTFYLYSGTID